MFLPPHPVSIEIMLACSILQLSWNMYVQRETLLQSCQPSQPIPITPSDLKPSSTSRSQPIHSTTPIQPPLSPTPSLPHTIYISKNDLFPIHPASPPTRLSPTIQPSTAPPGPPGPQQQNTGREHTSASGIAVLFPMGVRRQVRHARTHARTVV